MGKVINQSVSPVVKTTQENVSAAERVVTRAQFLQVTRNALEQKTKGANDIPPIVRKAPVLSTAGLDYPEPTRISILPAKVIQQMHSAMLGGVQVTSKKANEMEPDTFSAPTPLTVRIQYLKPPVLEDD